MVNVNVVEKLNSKKKNSFSNKIADKFKDACPSHKRKDLPTLIKKCSYDEKKVQAQIMEWWDEPQTAEEKWEDVSKKNTKRVINRMPGSIGVASSNRSSGVGRGRGRGYQSRNGNRVSRNERRSRDYVVDKTCNGGSVIGTSRKGSGIIEKVKEDRCPAPVRNIKPVQNAWGERISQVAIDDVIPMAEIKVDMGKATDIGLGFRSFPSQRSPNLPGFLDMENTIQNECESMIPSFTPQNPTTGNVWITKGSAHLIEAEKPRSLSLSSSSGVVHEVNYKRPIGGSRTSLQQQPCSNTGAVVEDRSPAEISLVTEVALDETIPVEVPIVPPPPTASPLGNGLSASVNGANVNAVGWEPISSDTTVISASLPTPTIENVQRSPVGHVSTSSANSVTDNPPPGLGNVNMKEESAPVTLQNPEPPNPTTVLNMGHWETGEGEEVQSLDFRFGSFGPENDIVSVDETTISSTTNNITCSQSTPVVPVQNVTSSETIPSSNTKITLSPSRPPPGLGIGMPQLPANVVHVHELENKLENVSLAAAKSKESSEKENESSLPTKKSTNSSLVMNSQITPHFSSQPIDSVAITNIHQGAISQNYPAAYGITTGGIYSYNAQSAHGPVTNAFIGVPNPQPQQKQQQQHAAVTGQHGIQSTPNPQGVVHQQHGSHYGVSTPIASVSDNPVNSESNGNTSAANAVPGIPPGIPNASMAYPQLYFQHQYQMSQPGVGYGYGYGQYGTVQGSYGYQQQLLSQSGGYGQPAYEDQTQHLSNHNHNNHSGNTHQPYNKSGGYRGRNNHQSNHSNPTHHNNQYQTQYSHQGHGGYNTQPYNIGYNDHFNQRTGYSLAGNIDPYMQGSAGYQSGINNSGEDQQLGKVSKSNSRNGFGINQNIHQYQHVSHPPGVQSQNQPSCVQVGSESSSHATSVAGTNGGLSYQNWGNGRL